MDDAASRDLLRSFESLPDPRAHNVVHPLANILLMAIMAVISGAGDWQAVQQWAVSKRAWLAGFLDLTAGIPSRDTFRRFFAALNPEAFEHCFLQWTEQLSRLSQDRLLAVDGKTIRRSLQRSTGKAAMHMVSVWCDKNRMVLGQLAVNGSGDKSNEITAIPKLLALLDLEGATVTIDAMGCQKAIAKQMVEQKGHYLLAVKENHPTLSADLRLFFDDAIGQQDRKLVTLDQPQVDGGHGRIETRQVWASGEVGWLKRLGHDWEELRGIVCVQSQRETLGPQGKTSVERRYYLTDHQPVKVGGPRLLGMTRRHWGVENILHWGLDVSFREDERRLRAGHGAENFSRLCRLALNLLKAETSLKVGVANKRLRCGWDKDYLLKVLMNLG